MNSKSDPLFLDWCSKDAAKFAVEHWHYSRRLPCQKLACIGVWESGQFTGAVVFGDGANCHLFSPYGLTLDEGAELVRVALSEHRATVTRIVAVAIRMFRKRYPGIKLLLSFADPEQGHVGVIYQAGGWLFLGKTTASDEYIVNGRRMHGRAARATRSSSKNKVAAENVLEWLRKTTDPRARSVAGSSKYRYAMPLDSSVARSVELIARRYKKPCVAPVEEAEPQLG